MSTKPRAQAEARPGPLRRLVRDAERFLAARQLAEAEKAAVCALAMEPDDAPALTCFARVQAQRGRYADAIDTFERALSRQPDDTALLDDLAQAQGSAGRLDAAIATLRRRVALRPDADGWFELGLMLDRNADCAEALDAARRAAA
ncbi:tetratricopeptide repeat protein, partial [Tahibacter caeni]|uniref:tetratricopeptide repeat protein n=1 Tax=Tahibacter caeni TaxID=1453545 RepID=UPI002149700C